MSMLKGFDYMDRKLLLAVLDKFFGGPVGLDNLAAAIGEERETIEDVLEPYLIQQGFLQRTPRGRMATVRAWNHFGITPPTGRKSHNQASAPCQLAVSLHHTENKQHRRTQHHRRPRRGVIERREG